MKKFLSTAEAAKILGISRIAVFQKIKSGEIKACKAGRNYIIKNSDLHTPLQIEMSGGAQRFIDKSIKKTLKEYGVALKMLKDS
ncbi:helix-turn-helix domain-containing protein [Candidatus Peregrinibacteria bacterium]|nr:helix-turn-helix domain-containing protein [Candidatus Peregrinibacteria bacterium]